MNTQSCLSCMKLCVVVTADCSSSNVYVVAEVGGW
jgi:hypothetical protein